jgi:Putative peptidoglycan binding domain
MYIQNTSTFDLDNWILQEVELAATQEVGMRGQPVRRIQEWLSLRGHPVVVDGIYGIATAEAVARFQEENGVDPDGRVSPETFALLVEPLRAALRQRLDASESLGAAIVEYAHGHLAQLPREVGGQNCGPWVRTYMRGNEGSQWAWCAGFASFLMHQAAQSLGLVAPIEGSFSCDTLVLQAKQAGLFVSESDARLRTIPPGSLFLNRESDTDWTHVGVVIAADELTLSTIEGNTNDDGSREGYEVCMRTRSYTNRDFIVFG